VTVTVLAVAFLIFVVAIAAFGYRIFIKRERSPEGENTEACTICRRRYDKTRLIERQIGDYRISYFCADCIASLHKEMVSRN